MARLLHPPLLMARKRAFKWLGKERRKPLRRSKAFDASCRNHGSCPYCQSNRQHADVKREMATARGLQEE